MSFKSITALFLVCLLVLSGCSSRSNETQQKTEATITEPEVVDSMEESNEQGSDQEFTDEELDNYEIQIPEFTGLNDPKLLDYVENDMYYQIDELLDDDKYKVEDVSAIYVSKEYINELEYNSKTNVFFGYSLEELDDRFEGTRYVFTLGDDGQTVVKSFEVYDDTYEKIIKNVAIGTGVIAICVVISVATYGSAPAISAIFLASAKGAAIMASSDGVLSFAASAITKGISTGDPEAALKEGALAGSEAFKYGAIVGAVTGAASKAIGLKYATLGRNSTLSMDDAAVIMRETGFPAHLVKQFHSMEEYNLYKNAGLRLAKINGRLALIRDIDMDYVSELGDRKVTNLERIAKGYSPIDPKTGSSYELHHVGQGNDNALAILTQEEHRLGSSKNILHDPKMKTEIDRKNFDKIRREFWKDYVKKIGVIQ